MKRHFNTHLEGIDFQFWRDLIESHGKLVSLKKGEYLCHKGEPTNVIGYLKSGYLIYTAGSRDKNHIGGFTFPDALFGDYPSCMHDEPALFDIIAGRKSEAWVMDATALPQLFETDVNTRRHGRLFMEAAYTSLVKRYYAIYAKNPKERYIDLTKMHPQIEQTVPQKLIAAYLCITPTHLCRLRKELRKQ